MFLRVMVDKGGSVARCGTGGDTRDESRTAAFFENTLPGLETREDLSFKVIGLDAKSRLDDNTELTEAGEALGDDGRTIIEISNQ